MSSLLIWDSTPRWHLPTLVICRRCGEPMTERDRPDVAWVGCDCGRCVETHTLGLHLMVWTYQRLRRAGTRTAADLDVLAAALGVRVADFQEQVNKIFVKTSELNLYTRTDGPYYGSCKIPLDQSVPLRRIVVPFGSNGEG